MVSILPCAFRVPPLLGRQRVAAPPPPLFNDTSHYECQVTGDCTAVPTSRNYRATPTRNPCVNRTSCLTTAPRLATSSEVRGATRFAGCPCPFEPFCQPLDAVTIGRPSGTQAGTRAGAGQTRGGSFKKIYHETRIMLPLPSVAVYGTPELFLFRYASWYKRKPLSLPHTKGFLLTVVADKYNNRFVAMSNPKDIQRMAYLQLRKPVRRRQRVAVKTGGRKQTRRFSPPYLWKRFRAHRDLHVGLDLLHGRPAHDHRAPR